MARTLKIANTREAKYDRKQVFCPNSSLLGYSRHIARFGDVIIFDEHGKTRTGRVIGRVAFSAGWDNVPAVKNQICAIVFNGALTHVSQRWIKPEDVTEVYRPEDAHHWAKRIDLLAYVFSEDFRHAQIPELVHWAQSGFSDMASYREYLGNQGKPEERIIPAGELPEHEGMKTYSLWFVDMDGNEDHLTIRMSWKNACRLHEAFDGRKHCDNPTISDFILHLDSPMSYADALVYIAEKGLE